MKRLHKVFAFNVNLFWVRDCADEVALLHERVLPGGVVLPLLRRHPPRPGPEDKSRRRPPRCQQAGFRVSVVEQKAPAVVGIIGRR